MKTLFRKFADNTDPSSLSARLRRARFDLFVRLLDTCADPSGPRILDLGGTTTYWKDLMGLLPKSAEIVLLNLQVSSETSDPRITSKAGDARDLRAFGDQSFDLVHSNSLIEHVGSLGDQARMAAEIRRVAAGYFVQTPNRYFPIEPHFLVPAFQFLPVALRVRLARRFRPGWYRGGDAAVAVRDAREIRLLSERELRVMFPDGQVWRERLYGLTKSFVVWRVCARAEPPGKA